MLELFAVIVVSLSPVPFPEPAAPSGARLPTPAGMVVWNQCGTYASGAAVRRGTAPTVSSAGDSVTCASGATATAGGNALACAESGCHFGTNIGASVPFVGATAAAGALGVCFTGTGTANQRIIGTDVSAAVVYFGDTNTLRVYDGTNFTGSMPYTPGARTCAIVAWSGSSVTLSNVDGSYSETGTYRGNFGSTTNLWLGSRNGITSWLNGSIERVCQDKSAALVRAACR